MVQFTDSRNQDCSNCLLLEELILSGSLTCRKPKYI